MTHRPAVHLAIPVDDLGAARRFYGGVLRLVDGRSTDHWIDWSLDGHQLVTHLVPAPPVPAGFSRVEAHSVPVPHFGLLVPARRFHELARGLRAAEVPFDIEPYLR